MIGIKLEEQRIYHHLLRLLIFKKKKYWNLNEQIDDYNYKYSQVKSTSKEEPPRVLN